jgi:hypothetical protein
VTDRNRRSHRASPRDPEPEDKIAPASHSGNRSFSRERNGSSPSSSDPHLITDLPRPPAVIRWWYWAVALGPVLSLAVLLWWTAATSVGRDAEKRAANAATQLAPGIREAWFAAVDEKLGERLIAADGLIKFTEPGGYLTWVPAQLVSVSCSASVGVWLEYGTSEYSPELSLLDHRERPSLGSGVGAHSPAARELLEEVCKRVTAAVRRASEVR